MKHYLNICDVDGTKIEPVDVITFGSPCTNLSIAGKREGLKHETKGDAMTTQSGLFLEAIRIIKEMREKTNGAYPKFAVWENVPGALSSNKGADFQIVLEEMCRIKDKTAVVPMPKKWGTTGTIMGNGYSVAWRVLDAQYYGVPQRRRRIFLVADFAGERAGKILFKPESVSGNPAESGASREGTSESSERCTGENVRGRTYKSNVIDNQVLPFNTTNITSPQNGNNPKFGDPCHTLAATDHPPAVFYSIENHPADSRVKIDKTGNVQTLSAAMGTGGGNVPMVMYPTYSIQGSMTGRKDENGPQGNGINKDVSFTLNATDIHGVSYAVTAETYMEIQKDIAPALKARDYKDPMCVCYERNVQYIVRRLTPTECARLQGFPDWWGEIDHKNDLTDEEFHFWHNVRNTHAAINGKTVKEYTKSQILTWYNKLHTDSAEYKMWGNGVALPCVRFVLSRIAGFGAKTLGSLFDGSGGFPLAGLLEGITPIWASEIEPYPIAVTTSRFSNDGGTKNERSIHL